MTISNGYATLTEFKNYARITSTNATDDGVIEDIIEAASRHIDAQTNRHFYASTETRYYSVPNAGDEGYPRELILDEDLLTVTTLTNGDSTVLTTSYYYLWPKNTSPKRKIILKESSTYYWTLDSSGNSEYVISVAGTWGYAATAPDDIKDACLQIATSFYHRRFGENTSSITTVTPAGIVITPQDIPGAAAATIQAYRRKL